MTDEQFENFKKVIKFESDKARNKFLNSEIAETGDPQQIEFFEGIRNSADFEFWWRMGLANACFAYISKSIYTSSCSSKSKR